MSGVIAAILEQRVATEYQEQLYQKHLEQKDYERTNIEPRAEDIEQADIFAGLVEQQNQQSAAGGEITILEEVREKTAAGESPIQQEIEGGISTAIDAGGADIEVEIETKKEEPPKPAKPAGGDKGQATQVAAVQPVDSPMGMPAVERQHSGGFNSEGGFSDEQQQQGDQGQGAPDPFAAMPIEIELDQKSLHQSDINHFAKGANAMPGEDPFAQFGRVAQVA